MCVKLCSMESLGFLVRTEKFVFSLKELIDLKMVQCERVVNGESFANFLILTYQYIFSSTPIFLYFM